MITQLRRAAHCSARWPNFQTHHPPLQSQWNLYSAGALWLYIYCSVTFSAVVSLLHCFLAVRHTHTHTVQTMWRYVARSGSRTATPERGLYSMCNFSLHEFASDKKWCLLMMSLVVTTMQKGRKLLTVTKATLGHTIHQPELRVVKTFPGLILI